MGYTKDMEFFRNFDVLSKSDVDLDSYSMKIHTLNFTSVKSEAFYRFSHPQILDLKSDESSIFYDSDEVNSKFSYPIFLPEGDKKYKKVIILLHGLNERSWIKYLPWASNLAQTTKSAVVLFPISYHINRAPKPWSDPHQMVKFLHLRSDKLGKDSSASFANVALSERLNTEPLRFLNSGYQSAEDIINLVTQMNSGLHPYIDCNPNVNFFSYSIGAFLAQILFIANPDNLLSDSRLFMFSGGAFFNSMNGVSKLIMDKSAFSKVYGYYNNDFEEDAQRQTNLGAFLRENKLAMAFRSMINVSRLRDFRNDMLSKLKDQMYAISLIKDTVIPATGVSSFFRQLGSKNIEMVDFAYPYSHEQPFPIIGKPTMSYAADGGFNHVFKRAASFLG